MNPSAEICVANIGPRQRRMRFIGGLVMLTSSIALMIALGGTSRLSRIWVFLPLLMTSVLFLQVQAQTCVALAARGQQDLDHGAEPVADAGELKVMKAQARQVTVRSVVIALLVTTTYLMI